MVYQVVLYLCPQFEACWMWHIMGYGNHHKEHAFDEYGRANFLAFVLEWVESILNDFDDVLRQADIYGAVVVSRYSYDFHPNVSRAFYELWGPLSNTFHHGNGEMGISLYDLKVIGGLPILGLPYDEFIPLNNKLCREDLYPSTVGELLRIHSQLCIFHKKEQVFHDQWSQHFSQGEAIYGVVGNSNNIIPKHKAKDLKFPLNISCEGQLAAFLAFWHSLFVMPLDNAIRLECFYMESLMARGFRVSLAPAVLGLICHVLSIVATHRRAHYPLLIRYNIEAKYVSSNKARIIFKSEFMVYRPSVFLAHEDCILLDMESLANDAFEFLICMHSALLPIRVVSVRGSDVGLRTWQEPKQSSYTNIPQHASIFRVPPALDHALGVVDRHIPRKDHIFVIFNLKSILTCMSKRGFNSSSSPRGASLSRGHKKRIRSARRKHYSGVNHVMHHSLRSSAYIEALGDVNVDLIHDLIPQHEECLNTKLAIETQLIEIAKEIDNLDVKDAIIKEAQERVHQMREEHEAKKTSFNMQKMNLEVSSEHQNQQVAQLQESRIDAKENLLPQIGTTRRSLKAQKQEIHHLINSIFSSCSKL
ncbi:unnamed protein product [Prunus armeniaca]|uniref:Aminotransferase-like plant mobile domain-containing protein n=1 Tax=Prunus armeniaca TaxID=36596 RepID=A0A6J5XR69_PRUAR|nr:unnamed protein product [Prunus armeniaca]